MQPKLSVFKNARSIEPLAEATVVDIVKRIQSTKYQPQTDYLRNLKEKEIDTARQYKVQNFIGVTWSGTFTPTRKKDNLQIHSGLICVDLDKLSIERLRKLHRQLSADEYTHVLFISPSGNGLKVVVRVEYSTPEDHKAFFQQLSDYYRDCYAVTATELDASGKNVDRLCFLPCDTNVYYNPGSEVMPLAEEYQNLVSQEEISVAQITKPYAPQEAIEDTTRQRLVRCIGRLQSAAIDLTDQYEKWVEIGLAFASMGDEGRIYFHQVSSLNSAYDYQQCEVKFNELLKNRNGRINIGTFFHHCDSLTNRMSDTGQYPLKLGVIEGPHEKDWPEPLPITTTLRPVMSLAPDMIPEPLRPWLLDIAYRMKCPLDFVAAGSVVVISSLIGTRCTIKPKSRDDWYIVPNLWGAIIGDPSVMKSPSIAEVLIPLNRLVTAAREEFKQKSQRYEADQVTYEAQKKVYQSQEKDRLSGKDVISPVGYPEPITKPAERRYMTNDTTIEKLADLLNENEAGLLVYRDEIIGLLAGWTKAGHEQDRTFYLEGWNGHGSLSIDRMARGTTHVKNVCISLMGGIQPAKLLGYLKAATGYENDGFVQRLQVAVYPDKAAWEYIDNYPDHVAKNKAFDLIRIIADANFKEISYDADEYNKFPYTRFNTQAQEIFKQWLINWETNVIPNESGLLLEHFTKYRSLMPSLALVFHVINHYDDLRNIETSEKALVSAEAATMAVRWCEYLMSHARRIYGLLDTAHTAAATELLRHLKTGALKDGFKAREVQQKGWSNLTSSDTIEAALAELVRCCWLHEVQPAPRAGVGRREASHYLIHPTLLQNV